MAGVFSSRMEFAKNRRDCQKLIFSACSSEMSVNCKMSKKSEAGVWRRKFRLLGVRGGNWHFPSKGPFAT